MPSLTMCPSEAYWLVRNLGALADWIVSDDVLDLARTFARQDGFPGAPSSSVAAEPGTCFVLCVSRDRQTGLRPAFALPLQWRAVTPRDVDEIKLPVRLEELARRVLQAAVQGNDVDPQPRSRATNRIDPGETHEWRLDWHPTVRRNRRPILPSWFALEADSGFASLAAGLSTAIGRSNVRSHVWASAARRGESFEPVADLDLKIAEAVRLTGADRMPALFFVAAQQAEEAKAAAACLGSNVEIKSLGHPQATQAASLAADLTPLSAAYHMRPELAAPFEDRAAYYLNITGEREARAYFAEFLLKDVIARGRRRLAERDAPPVNGVVAVRNPTNSPLSEQFVGLFLPCPVLYVESPTGTETAASPSGFGPDGDGRSRETFAGEADFRDRIAATVAAFRKEVGGPIAIDLTGGPKWMTLHLVRSAAEGDLGLYFSQDHDRHRRPPPESIVPEIWPLPFRSVPTESAPNE